MFAFFLGGLFLFVGGYFVWRYYQEVKRERRLRPVDRLIGEIELDEMEEKTYYMTFD